MINPIRKKLSNILLDMSKKGLQNIDESSSCAKKIKAPGSEELLKGDIDRICSEISIVEVTRVITLSAQIQVSSDAGHLKQLKRDLKNISTIAIQRLEKKTGKLNFPNECRNLLLNL